LLIDGGDELIPLAMAVVILPLEIPELIPPRALKPNPALKPVNGIKGPYAASVGAGKA